MPYLLLTTAGLVSFLYLIGLPAAFLLGSMGAAMVLVGFGSTLRLPAWIFPFAQGVVGCLIARSFTPELFRTISQHLALFIVPTATVLMVSTTIGIVLTRLRVLPGSTALWGSFPGAATAMVLLSDSFGGDMRLVALMQYLRVAVVVTMASLVGHLWSAGGSSIHHPPWLAPVAWPAFWVILGLVTICGLIVPRLKIPAGALLIPMAAATLLQNFVSLKIELPQPLLAGSYLIVGWTIGLRFTRDVFRQAARALPRVLASVIILVGICAAIGWVLAHIANLDGLTAYLATSPGGVDSIAIIAAGTPVDAPLVIAIQTGRLLAVLLLGPFLARGAARLTGLSARSEDGRNKGLS